LSTVAPGGVVGDEINGVVLFLVAIAEDVLEKA
jgi:hypothetical protein